MKTKGKRGILIIGIIMLCAMLCSGKALAWGPDRTTYTNEAPAPYAVFNSITDNVVIGDERNFVRMREADSDEKFRDEVEVEPGKEYEVFIYFHNNAATNTNETGYGVATGTRVASTYPVMLNPGDQGLVSGFIYWNYVTPTDPENAIDGKVWDEAYITTKTPNLSLRYKAGTAVIHNGGEADGSGLPTKLFSEDGAYIGYNKLTGIIPGCTEYSGYITYTLVAEAGKLDFVVPIVIAVVVVALVICGLCCWRKKQNKNHHEDK